MLATRYTMLGGRDFDDAIAELLLEQAKTTLDCEVDRTPVVMYKLHSAAEKIKRDLSAAGAQETEYSIMYLADAQDLDGYVTKEDVEAICKQKGDLFEVFYHFVFEMVSECTSDVKIDSVQICGSSMRIPQLQARLLEAVQHARQNVECVGNTLNMEEACARGCALFAQKYGVEKVLASSAEKVEVEVNGRAVSMDVFGVGVRGDGDGDDDGDGVANGNGDGDGVANGDGDGDGVANGNGDGDVTNALGKNSDNATQNPKDLDAISAGSNEAPKDLDAISAGSNEAPKDLDAISADSNEAPKDLDAISAGSNEAPKDLDAISAGSNDAPKDLDAISAGSNEAPKDLDAISADSNEAPKDLDAISTGSNDTPKDATGDTGLFAVNGNQPLQNGNDHDCTSEWRLSL